MGNSALQLQGSSMRNVIEAAARAAGLGGVTRQYFNVHRGWEAPLRQGFAERIAHGQASDRRNRQHAIELTWELAKQYKANRAVPPYPDFFDAVVSAIERRRWWLDTPPLLLGSTDDEAEELASLGVQVLSDLERNGHVRSYSLLTKWLHFCFPDSFAMADSQAAKSIEEI